MKFQKRVLLCASMLSMVGIGVMSACGDDDDDGGNRAFDDADMVRGGLLYDKWWTVTGVLDPVEPASSNPGYGSTAGTRTGPDTWRCKECHGWDYRGSDGAYGPGSSRFTGVSGLTHASGEDTPEALFDTIKNGKSGTAMSPFAAHLSDADVWDLVKFVKEGIIDETRYVDGVTKTPIGADVSRGQARFAAVCAACHGADGRLLNFGDQEEPEYVGTVAVDNPWEFLHKVRFGQPGTAMPSAIRNGWTVQDVVDVLGHAQTLPTR